MINILIEKSFLSSSVIISLISLSFTNVFSFPASLVNHFKRFANIAILFGICVSFVILAILLAFLHVGKCC